MAWSVCTLLLTAVALMASRASVPAGPDLEQGRAATRTLTRFVCAKCSATGHWQLPAGACSSVGWRSIATSQLRGPVPLPKWVSGIFKSMSGPVTSWPEPGARLDPRRSSDTSQKVPCYASVELSAYLPCNIHRYYHVIHAGSAVV